jgi:hypothetical protein
MMKLKTIWEKRRRIPLVLYRQLRVAERWLAKRTGLCLHGNERRLIDLKNQYLGQRCFIIGNGPSLTWNDLDRITNEKTFASNKIYLSYPHTEFRPFFYSVIDSYVLDNNLEEITAVNGLRLFPHYFEEKLAANDETIFFRSAGPNLGGFGFEPVLGRHFYGGYSVVFAQMQLAWYLGFREIYLIGMDHTWHIPEDAQIKDDGYYQVLTSGGEVNHFHPDYRKPGEKWTMPLPEQQEKAYQFAREFIEKNGGMIRNATRGGKLEVFERIDFYALFEA